MALKGSHAAKRRQRASKRGRHLRRIYNNFVGNGTVNTHTSEDALFIHLSPVEGQKSVRSFVAARLGPRRFSVCSSSCKALATCALATRPLARPNGECLRGSRLYVALKAKGKSDDITKVESSCGFYIRSRNAFQRRVRK